MSLSPREMLLALGVAALAGCGGGSGGSAPVANPTPTATPSPSATISVAPASYTFPLNDNTPAPFVATRSAGTFTSVGLLFSDPTVAGIGSLVLNGSTATFTVIPIAHGSTTITVEDPTAHPASVSVTTALCGRPPSLIAAQQVIPSPGATGVSPSIGKLYFVAYYYVGTGISGNLHMSLNGRATVEGGPLTAATLPPGTVLPSPIPLPQTNAVVVSAVVPPLAVGQNYQTQLYNDSCQLAVIAGTFST